MYSPERWRKLPPKEKAIDIGALVIFATAEVAALVYAVNSAPAANPTTPVSIETEKPSGTASKLNTTG